MVIKNFNERLFSLILFVLTFPILFISVILIKLTSKGPGIFKQERVGLDGEKFMCYKFRTMHIDTKNSESITKKRASRIF